MKVRYRYLERDPSLKKNNKELSSFILKGKLLDEKIKNSFENRIKKYLNNKYFISLSSGTNAIYLALKSAGIKKNDEVIVPCLSWMTTFTSVKTLGALPIGVDVDNDYHLDLTKIKERIGPKTKAIIYVHFAGLQKDLKKLKAYCDKKKIFLIEDCAQSFGSSIKKKFSGDYGHFGTYSFNPMKVLSSYGELGGISFKSKSYEKKINILKYGGIYNKEIVIDPELNHKSDNINLKIINLKLLDLNKIIKRRIKIAKFYNQNLNKKYDRPKYLNNGSHIYYSYIIQTNLRDKLIKFLKKNNIETKIQHKNLIYEHKMLKYLNHKKYFSNGNKLKNKILSLPIDENLNVNEIKYIVNKLNQFCKKFL